MDQKKFMLICATSLILAAWALAAAEPLQAAQAGQKIDPVLVEKLKGGDGEKIPVIVMLKGEADPGLNDFNVKYRYQLIPGLAGEATPSSIEEIAKNDAVQGVYLDGSAQISAPENSSSGGEYLSPSRNIQADKLWEKGIDGRGVTVAVIDSGIDKNHPDLIGKVIGEKNFVADEITADDLLGHGTMVAGIIAGSGVASNGKYKGVAPGASLLNVKVIDSKGDGKVSDIIAGIEWAIYNGADVLSLSLGGINLGETNPPITMAADNAADAGVVVCVAAGNRNSTEAEGQVKGASASQVGGGKAAVDLSQVSDGKNKDVLLLLVPVVLALPPGLIDSPGDGVKVITLGASDGSGHVAGFSGSGPTRDDRIKPDVVAPGVDVVSAAPPGLKRPAYIDVYYARESGTSLSTPVAAGLAALLLQENANLTPAGVKAAMTRGAQKLNNTLSEEYEEYYQGAGLLDALGSYQIQSNDICGAIPDRWIAGRWAYLPAGEGVYVGLDTGADRPQKKLYALAPGDNDWNTRFVFFSNQEKKNLRVSVSGAVSDWVSLQALPQRIEANDQEVFAASMTVPIDTAPGIYNGSINVAASGAGILSIPIGVTVAEPFNISNGLGSRTGILNGNEWDYYYLDIPPGTTELKASLEWTQDSNLDLFLLSPPSEYYAGVQNTLAERTNIESPSTGRWLLAVHSENSSVPVNYTLDVERALIETFPKRWNLESAYPGTSSRVSVVVKNGGPTLKNLSYAGVIENATSEDLVGSVSHKGYWNYTVNVTEKTRRLSANLRTEGNSSQSEIMFVFENPKGEPVDYDLGTGDLGPLEISNPEVGPWRVRVYGYNVSTVNQPFQIALTEYGENQWTWIKTRGPEQIESGSEGTIEANLTIPRNTSLPRLDGFIKIYSDSQTIQIPVSVVVAGTSLKGLTFENVKDRDQDGYFDDLDLGFGVNSSAPGDYRLEGVLTDCSGNMIDLFSSSVRLEASGSINVSVNGSDIWSRGKCGPLQIQNLILYDKVGNFIDRYGKNITIERDPKQFQPPAAHLTGDFVNRTTTNKIGIGVNLSVTKTGSYQLNGSIVNDGGEELGQDTKQSKLVPGNATLVLEYNPTKFMMLNKVSRVHLVDLALSLNGSELERRDEAWSSGDMDPNSFKTVMGTKSAPADSNNNSSRTMSFLRRENGKTVIS
jgi:subtilisin family serine protease